jgi:hypothetical protein
MRLSRALSFVAAAALTAACGGSGDMGRVTVKLTDAPANMKAAVVTITKVSLHGTGGETVLTTTKTTTNLLTLAGATADLVKDAVVKPGSYQELRFQISGGYVEVPAASGTGTEIFASSPTYEGLPAGAVVKGVLKMPSLAQSGLKVDFIGDALEIKAESKVLLVDFDVAQSFGHDTGSNADGWVMHPVIKGADITISGNVHATIKLGSGVNLPVVSNAQTTLGQFKAVLKSTGSADKELTFTDKGGGIFGASFLFLMPGAYSVDVVAPSGVGFTATPGTSAPVTVGQGVDANADFVVTSASAL